MLCMYCKSPHGFNSSCQKLSTSNWPLGKRSYATGCCIQASVTMMKNPEIHEPTKTITAENQCIHLETRLSPYRKRPRKADSRKKLKTPSMARGWPITPPESREK